MLSIFISYNYLEIVDWVLILSVGLFPGTVSITTKSMGDSELRPICKENKGQLMYVDHTDLFQVN